MGNDVYTITTFMMVTISPGLAKSGLIFFEACHFSRQASFFVGDTSNGRQEPAVMVDHPFFGLVTKTAVLEILGFDHQVQLALSTNDQPSLM